MIDREGVHLERTVELQPETCHQPQKGPGTWKTSQSQMFRCFTSSFGKRFYMYVNMYICKYNILIYIVAVSALNDSKKINKNFGEHTL